MDACTRDGIVFMSYFPLARGLLRRDGGALATIALRHGATPAQVALAWLLVRSPVLIAIPGTSSVAHLEENLGAAALRLTADDIAVLDALR